MIEVLDLSPLLLGVILFAAFLTSVLHGATGMAGGIVMALVLSYIIGVKPAFAAMTCALIFSHASRATLYFKDTDWSVCIIVLLFSIPTIALGAVIFGYLSGSVVALMMAVVLIVSFPVKRYAQRQRMKTSKAVLAGASSVWGVLAGNVIGPGFFLAPFLLGTGMGRMTFVGTLATVVLVMNVVKTAVFGVTDLLDARLLLIGVLIGLVTIPGNWVGKQVLKRMSDQGHRIAVDVMTVLVILNFLYLGLR